MSPFSLFASISLLRYTSPMAASDLKNLPAPARKRIEKLETTVSQLVGELGWYRTEMKRRGLVYPGKKVSPAVREPSVRRAYTARAATPAVPANAGLAAAVARGEAAKVEWVSSGEVVPAKTLAEVWGLTPQALGPAAERGEVFAVVVKRQRYFPKEFLELDRDDVGAVSKALGSLSPAEKLVFWKRPHGSLGGKTVLQLLTGKKDGAQLGRVIRLARAWAAEAQAETDVAEAA